MKPSMRLSSQSLWYLVAAIVPCVHILMVATTQHNDNLLLLALVVWCGAFLCLEDQLPALELKPTYPSLFSGIVLLSWCLWRMTIIHDLDVAAWLLPPVIGMGLFSLTRSLRRLKGWLAPIAALTLLPLSAIFLKILPEQFLSLLTTRIAQIAFLIFGADADANGRQLLLSGGSVTVAGECSGDIMITQSLIIACLFALAFPLPRKQCLPILLLMSGIIAWTVNVVRIIILAMIHASSMPGKTWWFEFIHKGAGSLAFSAIAVSIYSWIYLRQLDRQLTRLEKNVV